MDNNEFQKEILELLSKQTKVIISLMNGIILHPNKADYFALEPSLELKEILSEMEKLKDKLKV